MNDEDRELDVIGKQLRSRLPSLKDAQLTVDLWPNMLRRLDESAVTFGWFESILVGLVAVTFAIFPELLAAMLWHL